MDTNKIKKGLGRGLSSLIGETKAEININKVSISDLVSNKFQPRKTFDEDSLQDLTNSIKERGIIQPIIVRKSSDDSSKYEIIAGERRWLSAQKAGLHEVPVVIADVDDLKSLEFAIVENVQRQDLNAIEEARDYFSDKVYVTVIPRNVRLSEAPSHGMPDLFYDKLCPGSKSYFNFTDEFINQEQKIGSAA